MMFMSEAFLFMTTTSTIHSTGVARAISECYFIDAKAF